MESYEIIATVAALVLVSCAFIGNPLRVGEEEKED